MAKPAPNRTAQLAQIHIAKKELSLDDDTYRAVLWACARVKSSADLDYAGRARVLDHFKAKGWQNKSTKPDVAKAKQKLIAKVSALLTDMQLSWAYADGVAKQMYKREKLQWCTPFELRGVITALVNKQKKHTEND